MSGTDKQPETYSKEEYERQIAELIQVNGIWKNDYGELLHQNQQLKAALGMNPNSGRSTRSNSPHRHSQTSSHLQPANTEQDPHSIRSTRSNSPNRHSEATNLLQDLQLGKRGSNSYPSSINQRPTTAALSPSSSTVSSLEDTEPSSSLYSPISLSPRQHRKQHAETTPSYPPSRPYSSRSLSPPTTYIRSNSDGQQRNIIEKTEGYIQCAVADIEKMKEQIRAFKDQYEREREEKEKEITKNKNLKRKLTENEEITFQLHQRIDILEKKLKKVESERVNMVEQQRKAELMGRGAFPRNEYGFTGYKDERDSMTTRYQQQQLQQHDRREFEGGTTDLKHQKFRQIYPLIY